MSTCWQRRHWVSAPAIIARAALQAGHKLGRTAAPRHRPPQPPAPPKCARAHAPARVIRAASRRGVEPGSPRGRRRFLSKLFNRKTPSLRLWTDDRLIGLKDVQAGIRPGAIYSALCTEYSTLYYSTAWYYIQHVPGTGSTVHCGVHMCNLLPRGS